MTTVQTTGYQGESIESFVRKLQDSDVDLVIDVRRFAHSRKRGFSKRRLTEILREHEIEYAHFPELGMPKHLLSQRGDDNSKILQTYEKMLPQLETEIHQLVETIVDHHSCLMCFESEPSQCHRSRLADYLRSKYSFLTLTELHPIHACTGG